MKTKIKEYAISRETAIVSLTALRNFYASLDETIEVLENSNGHHSASIESAENFKQIAKNGYTELQKKTGDRTPLEIRK